MNMIRQVSACSIRLQSQRLTVAMRESFTREREATFDSEVKTDWSVVTPSGQNIFPPYRSLLGSSSSGTALPCLLSKAVKTSFGFFLSQNTVTQTPFYVDLEP